MDKTEKFIKDGLSDEGKHPQIDIDAVIAGTHSSIKRRATRRKILYSSPLAILLVIMGIALFPEQDKSFMIGGEELLTVGLEQDWIVSQNLELEGDQEDELYDQTVDYLIDDNYYTYFDEAEELLDEIDLEALKGYLKEA